MGRLETMLPLIVITILNNVVFTQLLRNLPSCEQIWIGFSGGPDSTALLHLFYYWAKATQQPQKISALHIHHGLQKEADEWALHCRNVCTNLAIDYHEQRINVQPVAGKSTEDVARRMRYAAMAQRLTSKDVFCTAHHGDDQAETVLLQLIRGSGPQGLAAMPESRRLGAGWLYRPLLNVSKEAITDYLKRFTSTPVIDDPSNADPTVARAFVRHRVITLLKQHYPSITKILVRNARWQQEALEILRMQAAKDLMTVHCRDRNTLSCDVLAALPLARSRAVVRLWIKKKGYPCPRSVQLDRWLANVLSAGPDRSPVMQLGNIEVRCYRQYLYFVRPLPKETINVFKSKHWSWTLLSKQKLPVGYLRAVYTKGPDLLHANLINQSLYIRFRQGGERIKLSSESKSHPLKDLWQKYAVPPWERWYIPLIYRGMELIAVPGLGVASCVANREHQFGWALLWEKNEA